jgi:hypothetical protein
MCCLNVPLTFALYYICINPYDETYERTIYKKILIMLFLLVSTPITIVLDIILLPFNIISRIIMKYYSKEEISNNGSDMYNLIV